MTHVHGTAANAPVYAYHGSRSLAWAVDHDLMWAFDRGVVDAADRRGSLRLMRLSKAASIATAGGSSTGTNIDEICPAGARRRSPGVPPVVVERAACPVIRPHPGQSAQHPGPTCQAVVRHQGALGPPSRA
jgi:hypothetical protein